MAKNSKKTFYITTPIYYVNDVPHIGHAYTTIIADALSRFKKLCGCDVFFLTGTDEHGQKIEKSASEKDLSPIELADKVVVRFKNLWKSLNISYDFFIRTTDSRHETGVQKIFQRLQEKGDIYKGTYTGYYCVSCENFLSDDVPLEKEGYKICPDCEKQAGEVAEECYFFTLSSYQKKLLDFYDKNPEFVRPKSRMNEVTSFVRRGLKDLSITRTTVKWGVPVPGDPEHTIYVWFDALHNYVTGIGYDWDQALFYKFWPADVHLVGKDILRFHAIFWPAFLLAAGFPLPETVYGHGWWMKDGSKMSKSRGNVLDPDIILETFGPDPLRYFLLREVPIGLDGNFSHEGFIHRVNSDLANDLGNLVQRSLTMIVNYFGGKIIDPDEEGEADKKLHEEFRAVKTRVYKHYEEYNINRALEEIWVYINTVNKYLAEHEPWLMAKDEKKKGTLARVLYQTASALRTITYLVYPVMPESSEKIWSYLGEKSPLTQIEFNNLKFEDYNPVSVIQKPDPLFPRVSLKEFLEEEPRKKKIDHKEKKMDVVTYEEFRKMDFRAGKILEAEKVEGTKKLIKITIDIGEETRQMISGIADTYSPEDLIGKTVVVITNLKPALIRGIQSNAMLLAAVVDDKAVIPFFNEDVPPGAKVL
ncbi:MAG TPA: methionine--tRNA ligase [bacterium]|nr:methionine--tRNA ligase [bacterium]